MSKTIQAVSTYSPRIDLGATVQQQELSRFLSSRTGVNKGEVELVLSELQETIVHYCGGGRGVKLEGIGTFLPSIKLDGRFKLSFRLDPAIKFALNAPGGFNGRITNRENIGLTLEDLIFMWNEAHPNDPVQ